MHTLYIVSEMSKAFLRQKNNIRLLSEKGPSRPVCKASPPRNLISQKAILQLTSLPEGTSCGASDVMHNCMPRVIFDMPYDFHVIIIYIHI